MTHKFVCATFITAMLWSSVTHGAELIFRQDWAKITNATSVLQLPALQRVLSQFEVNDNSKIVIQYPGGDQGNQWAIELHDWLVSLGISSRQIQLQPGSGIPDAIMIKTEPGGLQ